MRIIKLYNLLVLALLLPACKPDDCPVEPDPCAEYPEKMEIEILETNNLLNATNETWYVPTKYTDFVRPTGLAFKMNYNYDSIVWQIGSDPSLIRNTTARVSFPFGFIGDVTVRAIGYREINNTCFGTNDDGIDTLYKTITYHRKEDSIIFGTYRGTNDGESDSFNITIRPYQEGDVWGEDYSYHYGLPNGNTFVKRSTTMYNKLYGRGDDFDHHGIRNDDLYAELLSDNRTLKFYWRYWEGDTRQRVFTGIKIN